MPVRKRAQRMSPDKRREQIMDSAVTLIVSRGLSSCTLEVVAAEARISKPPRSLAAAQTMLRVRRLLDGRIDSSLAPV